MLAFQNSTDNRAKSSNEVICPSPKHVKVGEKESFLIRPTGARSGTSGGSIGSNATGLRFNIAIMGDKGSGKTSLIHAMLDVSLMQVSVSLAK